MLMFSFPWPPSINRLYVPIRGKRGKVMSKEGRDYKSFAICVVRTRMKCKGWNSLEEPSLFAAYFYPYASIRNFDVSNHVKVIEDSLQEGGAIKNDNLFHCHYLRRMPKEKIGTVKVFLLKISEINEKQSLLPELLKDGSYSID